MTDSLIIGGSRGHPTPSKSSPPPSTPIAVVEGFDLLLVTHLVASEDSCVAAGGDKLPTFRLQIAIDAVAYAAYIERIGGLDTTPAVSMKLLKIHAMVVIGLHFVRECRQGENYR